MAIHANRNVVGKVLAAFDTLRCFFNRKHRGLAHIGKGSLDIGSGSSGRQNDYKKQDAHDFE
ncbi:hypothetical protein D3C87_1803910 [compost metagenome]